MIYSHLDKPEKHQRIEKVLGDVENILKAKDQDYGGAFEKRFAKHGILSAFIRMEDKFLRLENLIGGSEQQVKDESLLDTCRDLIGYLTLTIIELEKLNEVKNGIPK